MESQQNKWVIIFLIYADFIKGANNQPSFETLYAKELDEVLKSLLKTNINPDNSEIYIIYGSLNFVELKANQEILTSQVNLFQLTSGTSKNTFDHLKTFENSTIKKNDPIGAFSIQRSDSLKEIFKYIYEIYKCQKVKFIVNTWDHGAVFGIFKIEEHITVVNSFPDITKEEFPYLFKLIHKIPKTYSSPIAKNSISFVKSNILYETTINHLSPKQFIQQYELGNFTIKKESNFSNKLRLEFSKAFFKEGMDELQVIQNDNYNLEPTGILAVLTNEELAKAIINGLGTVEVLVMMNCWMMNLHCIYAFRDCVNYYVAPQGPIGDPGYNYKKVIEFIGSAGEISAESISIKYIDTAYNFNSKKRKSKKIEIKSWSLIAMKVKENKDLINQMLVTTLSDFLTGAYSELITIKKTDPLKFEKIKFFIQYFVKTSFNFAQNSQFYQIDLLNLIRNLSIYNSDSKGAIILKSLGVNGTEGHIWNANIKHALNDLIIYNPNKTPDCYLRYMLHPKSPFIGTNIYQPNGISIYFSLSADTGTIEHSLFLLNQTPDVAKLADHIPDWNDLINLVNS